SFLRSSDGSLWIGSHQGLLHLHEGKADVFSEADGLSGDFVGKILEDHEGNIWVATTDGVDRFRPYVVTTFSVKQGLPNALSVLADKDGNIWISTPNGLDKWKQGQISAFDGSRGAQKSDGKLNGQPPTSLFQDSDGRIWVATNH